MQTHILYFWVEAHFNRFKIDFILLFVEVNPLSDQTAYGILKYKAAAATFWSFRERKKLKRKQQKKWLRGHKQMQVWWWQMLKLSQEQLQNHQSLHRCGTNWDSQHQHDADPTLPQPLLILYPTNNCAILINVQLPTLDKLKLHPLVLVGFTKETMVCCPRRSCCLSCIWHLKNLLHLHSC